MQVRKRQKKKNSKKYLRIFLDEAPLLYMTIEERQIAHKEYLKYLEKYAFRKQYKDLKDQKNTLYYIPQVSKMERDWRGNVSDVGRRNRKS